MDEKISVELTKKEWIKIMNLIQEAPLKDVFNIFINIDQQLILHEQQHTMPAAETETNVQEE